MKYVVLALIGLAGGILGGMGLGGGTLLIPLMTLLSDVPQKTAAAINLIGFVPMAAIAVAFHAKNGLIDKKLVLPIVIPASAVCAVFSAAACDMDNRLLSRSFGIFLTVLGAIMLTKDALSSLGDKLRVAMLAVIRRDLPYTAHNAKRK